MFSKTDTAYYKGLGILLIAIHNYYHIRPGFGLENEMSFKKTNLANFITHLAQFNLDSTLAAIFGYLGHYGVQLFIFFSAYGLSIQYAKKQQTDLAFVGHRLKKIYFLMLYGIILVAAGFVVFGRPDYSPYRVLRDTLLLGSTLNNFSRNGIYELFAGPFWFFGLIIQIYVLFPYLYRQVNPARATSVWIAFALTYVVLYVGYYASLNTKYGVMGSVIGHAPEVLLGICFAKFGVETIQFRYALGCLVVFILSQMFEWMYPLSFVSVTIFLLWSFRLLQGVLHTHLLGALVFTGNISMIVFVLNSKIRSLGFFHDQPSGKLVLFLALLMVVSYVFWWIYERLAARLKIN